MMRSVTDAGELQRLRSAGAVFVLYGAAHCQVCGVLRPQLDALLTREYPEFDGVYVDCARTPALCAQNGIFSLPVLQVYLDGSMVVEAARAFGLQQLRHQLERPVALWRAGGAAD